METNPSTVLNTIMTICNFALFILTKRKICTISLWPTLIRTIVRTMVDTSDMRTDISNRTPTIATMVDCHGNQNAAIFFFLCFGSFNMIK